MKHSPLRLQAILSLAGVALLPLALGIFAAMRPDPLPPEADRLSLQATEAMARFEPFGWLLLGVGILVAVILWRRSHQAAAPLLEIEPVPWTPPLVAVLTLAWLVAQALASIPLGLALYLQPSLAERFSASAMIAVVWLFGAVVGLLLPLCFVFRGRLHRAAQLGLHLPHRGKEFLWGFLAFATFPALVFLGLALTYRLGKFDPLRTNPVFSVALGSTGPLDWVILFLLVALLGPALEEFLFRGLLYRSLRNLWPPAPAILISAFFFSAIHPSVATLLPVALLGMVLAYLYEKTGSLVPGMVAHGLYNGSALAAVLCLQHFPPGVSG